MGYTKLYNPATEVPPHPQLSKKLENPLVSKYYLNVRKFRYGSSIIWLL